MGTNTQPSTSHTMGRRNRRHTPEFKRAVVEQSYVLGISVSRLAREHQINANQVFAWRKQYRDAGLARTITNTTVLLPVSVVESVSDDIATVVKPQTDGIGTMELTVGDARLTISGSPDAACLRIVLAQLLR